MDTIQRVLRFPLVKILFAFLFIGLSIAGIKWLIQFILPLIPGFQAYDTAIIGVAQALVAIFSYWLFVKYYESRKPSEIHFTGLRKWFLPGLSIGFLLQSLVIVVMFACGFYTILRFNSLSAIYPALIMGITAGVMEEIFIRGIVFRIIEESLGSIWAVVISAAIFGLLHITNAGASLFSVLSIAIQAGGLLAAAYVYSRSLWFPISIHFAWNFTESGIYGASVSGFTTGKSWITSRIEGNELLTGGNFGPENALQATVFCLIVTVYLLWKSHEQGKWIAPFWRSETFEKV